LLVLSSNNLFHLKFESRLASSLGQGFNPAMVLVSSPVENYLIYPLAQGSLSQHVTDNPSMSRLGFAV
jgi:hypothetical protein